MKTIVQKQDETFKPISITFTLESLQEVQRFYSIFYNCSFVADRLVKSLNYDRRILATQLSSVYKEAYNEEQNDIISNTFCQTLK